MNKLPPCDHDCCPPTHCELDRLKAENARLAAILQKLADAYLLDACDGVLPKPYGPTTMKRMVLDAAREELARLRVAREGKV